MRGDRQDSGDRNFLRVPVVGVDNAHLSFTNFQDDCTVPVIIHWNKKDSSIVLLVRQQQKNKRSANLSAAEISIKSDPVVKAAVECRQN